MSIHNFTVQAGKVKRQLRGLPVAPRVAGAGGTLSLGAADVTFVLVCAPDFDSALPNAGTTCRIGWEGLNLRVLELLGLDAPLAAEGCPCPR